ncbi:MAG: hypothetical protein AB7N80_12600 [Bdellovibrionales bacterium]
MTGGLSLLSLFIGLWLSPSLLFAAQENFDRDYLFETPPESYVCDQNLIPPEFSPRRFLIPSRLRHIDTSKIHNSSQEIRALIRNLKDGPYVRRYATIQKLRELLLKKSEQDIKTLRFAMSQNTDGHHVPLVIIGAGVHAAIIRLVASEMKVPSITLEASDALSAETFSSGGSAFRLTTASEQNLIPGSPVQMPLLTSEKAPRAREMELMLWVAHAAATGKLLFNSQVGPYQIIPQPDGHVEVHTENGLKLFAQVVINTTGMTLPEDLFENSNDRSVVQAVRAQMLATDAPRFQYFQDYLRSTKRNANVAHHNLPYANKVVAVIGKGLSARTVIRNMAGLGPSELYPSQQAKASPRQVLWLNGHEEDANALAAKLPQLKLIQGRVEALSEPAPGWIRIQAGSRQLNVQAIISTTGYKTLSLLDLVDVSHLRLTPVDMELKPLSLILNGDVKVVAQQLLPVGTIYSVGAAAIRNLIPGSMASIPQIAPRTRAFAEKILSELTVEK